ncbi:MAG: hypothetical protein C4B57_03035 [Deltaproteobacteria bacterium]|nr:MAG: hypothetical protein C4B57_03035 [Deltaproteobacteria bacterium]
MLGLFDDIVKGHQLLRFSMPRSERLAEHPAEGLTGESALWHVSHAQEDNPGIEELANPSIPSIH